MQMPASMKDEAMMRTGCERLLATAFEGERVLQLGADAPKPIERVATVREIVPPATTPAEQAPDSARTSEAPAPVNADAPSAPSHAPADVAAPVNADAPAAPNHAGIYINFGQNLE